MFITGEWRFRSSVKTKEAISVLDKIVRDKCLWEGSEKKTSQTHKMPLRGQFGRWGAFAAQLFSARRNGNCVTFRPMSCFKPIPVCPAIGRPYYCRTKILISKLDFRFKLQDPSLKRTFVHETQHSREWMEWVRWRMPVI